MLHSLALLASIGCAVAGTVIWDGRFNEFTSSTDLNNWSWSNEVGPYQYYIHGSSAVTAYVNLSPSYKNPADSGSKQGAKITLDSTAYWNGQTMRRTELIPQTTAAINQGLVYYHFSIKRSATNAPSLYREHQICFFESHFTELKAGWISGEAGTSDPLLRWDIGGTTKWSVNWDADVWHNVAYGIDFSANTVTFYHSTGSDPLVLTTAAQSVSTSSNGADWHLGVLELPRDGYSDTTEDYFFSGVYIESGSLTTSVAGPGGVVVSSSVAASSSTSKLASSSATTLQTSTIKSSSTTSSTTAKASTTTSSTTAKASTTTSSAVTSATGATVAKWGQCGGTGYTGSTVCASGSTCTFSNAWYSQCL